MTRSSHPWLAAATAVLQIAAFMPYLLAGLIAPEPALTALRLLWVALAVVAVVVYRRNPRLALAVPGLTVLLGVGSLVLGGAFLGWEG